MLQQATETTNEAASATAQASPSPTSVEGVVATLESSVLGIWSDFVGHMPYLVMGLVVLGATAILARLSSGVIHRLAQRARVRASLDDLLQRLGTITLWLSGTVLAAMIVFPGLTPSSALGALGVASLAIGFAFKDIFENFFAGVLMLWRFPFESGDHIECEDVSGTVEKITIRMTMIRTTDGELVVLPNSFLFKNPVEVLTHESRRRVQLMCGVSYDTDVEHAVGVLEEALAGCDTVDHDRPVQVYPTAFGSSSVDIDVRWWTSPRPGELRKSRAEVVPVVKRALEDAGIEIPFPYRTLTFKEALPLAREGGGPTAGD